MKVETLVIDNFQGQLSRDDHGDINSGFAKYTTTFGANPFPNPGNLTWFEQPISILTTNNGGITSAKVRLETDTTVVYAISGENVANNNPTLYKIQVNDTTGHNPDYDFPSVIGGIPNEAGSIIGVLYGPSMQFYGSTEKIFLGTDERISKINFDGSGATKLTAISSITTNVPRPSAQFLGKMYWGNGNNLIEIDSTEIVTSYAKLNPGFPSGTYIRDLDVSPDGNYLQITVSKNNSSSLNQFNTDTSPVASNEAYKFLWNGTDSTYSSYETYPGYSLTANTVFGENNFTLGTDLNGAALYSGATKIITLPQLTPANYAAAFSTGNLFGFAATEYNSSMVGTSAGSVVGMQASGFLYGQYDNEVPTGLFRTFKQSSTSPLTEMVRVPVCLPVSNLAYTYQAAGYTNNIIGSGKLYFSTTEYQSGSTIRFKLYKFLISPTGAGTAIGGVYETQSQLFSKKITIKEIRLYTEPLVANNSFKVDLIGSDNNPIPNGSKTFTVGSNVTAGQDYLWWTPQIAPTYALGLRFTNLGTVNWTGVKAEIDYSIGGK